MRRTMFLAFFLFLMDFSAFCARALHCSGDHSKEDESGASLICLELCDRTFQTHLHNEYADYRYAATLQGLHLRNFLRHSDEPGRLGVFCKKVFKPFAKCTKKCPESLGKFYNLLQYQSFSILCWADPPSFHNALPCLREAEASTRKSCSEFRRTHARNLNGLLKHLATVNKTGVKNVAGMKADTPEFCRSMKKFLDCEKRVESEKCGLRIVELEQQMHYGTFWSFRALLHRANLHIDDYQCDWIPEPTSLCKTDDHVDYPMNDDNNQNVKNADGIQKSEEKMTEMKQVRAETISSSEDPSFCDIFCNDVLYNFTFKPHLTRYSIIDQLHGIDLRSFLKISRPEELSDYCNSIFLPYLNCSNSCKSTERNISRLNSLTYICITKFKDISKNLVCLKWVDEASFQVCSNHFKSHKESFTKLDDALGGNENQESLLKLSSDYCPKLESLLHCENFIYYDECGSVMAGVQRQLMLMILDDVNERLIDHHEHSPSEKEICGGTMNNNNNNNIHLPEVCRRLYSEFLENSKNFSTSPNIMEISSMVHLFLLVVSVIFSL